MSYKKDHSIIFSTYPILFLVLFQLDQPSLPIFVLPLGTLRRPDESQIFQLLNTLCRQTAFLLVAERSLLVKEFILLPRIVNKFSE
jgi:hypothetical protein